VSYLDLARRLRTAHSAVEGASDLDGAPLVEVRERIGAVRLRSPVLGDVWLALDAGTATELEAEEAGVPVLRPSDLGGLRGKSPETLRAVLATLAAFPGARVRH
jgi:hypothetical protein